jgi:hypothetical protein
LRHPTSRLPWDSRNSNILGLILDDETAVTERPVSTDYYTGPTPTAVSGVTLGRPDGWRMHLSGDAENLRRLATVLNSRADDCEATAALFRQFHDAEGDPE